MNTVRKLAIWSALIMILLAGIPGLATAQNTPGEERFNYAGKDFWMALRQGSAKCNFFISGAHNATLTFSYTLTGATQTYSYTAGTVQRIGISNTQANAISEPIDEVVSQKTLHISSDSDVVIQFVNGGGATDDAMLLFPSDNQHYGANYFLNGGRVNSGTAAFTMVARCDSTVLEITPTDISMTHASGVPFTLVLNRGQSYRLVAANNPVNDLSGTKVSVLYASCCNPLNVFVSYYPTYMVWPFPVPGSSGGCCADQQIEQLLPESTWDTLYPVVRFSNNPFSVIKLVSATNNNTIYVDGSPVVTLNAGGRYDTIVRNPVVITSTDRISVTQHMMSQSLSSPSTGSTPVDSMSDPSTLLLLSLRDGFREVYFKALGTLIHNNDPNPPTISTWYRKNVITLISKAANVNTIQVNGVNIGAQFLPFPNNAAYKYTYIDMDTTIPYHIVSQERIIGYYYGAYSQGSAAMPLGDIHASTFVSLAYTGTDTITICDKNPVPLTAGQAYTYYWSTGATTQQISVDTAGVYLVQMRYNDSCNTGDWKRFVVNKNDPLLTSVSDTLYKCLNQQLVLAADPADQYVWSDGSTGQQITITQPERTYTVVEKHTTQCRYTTHHFVIRSDTSNVPVLDLGNDTALCKNQQVILNGYDEQTQWSDGSRGRQLIVNHAGIYWAMAYDSCLERVVTDTLIIRDTVCARDFCSLTFPSAFTPNNDSRNDKFRPVTNGQIDKYVLRIYNRWGEKIFQSFDKSFGWDGNYKGNISDLGVYYYLCTYECPLYGKVTIKGEVTLVR